MHLLSCARIVESFQIVRHSVSLVVVGESTLQNSRSDQLELMEAGRKMPTYSLEVAHVVRGEEVELEGMNGRNTIFCRGDEV